MKKVSVILSMFVLAATASFAQGKVVTQDFHFKMNDGPNTLRVPNNGGTIQLVKRGDKFTDVVYTDAAGTSSRLSPTRPGTNGAPAPACKYPIPDACYSIPNNQNIGMCICKPTDVKSNDDYTVTLLLPAVQKVREAGRH